MSMDGQGTKCRRNVAENFNRLSRVHERYRRQTDGRAIAYSEREREFTFASYLADPVLGYSEVVRLLCPIHDTVASRRCSVYMNSRRIETNLQSSRAEDEVVKRAAMVRIVCLKADTHYPYVWPVQSYVRPVRTGAFFNTRTNGPYVRLVRIGLKGDMQ